MALSGEEIVRLGSISHRQNNRLMTFYSTDFASSSGPFHVSVWRNSWVGFQVHFQAPNPPSTFIPLIEG